MKKALIPLLAVCLSATVLSGCGAPKPSVNDSPQSRTRTEQKRETYEGGTGGGRLGGLFPIFGVRRRLSISGNYTVEYVHRQRNAAPDDTLDYSISLRDDNTYNMNVTVNGVRSEHYGNYYVHDGGGMTLYFDEPIDKPAHNEYVSDCMYAEILPQGKLMIYDGGNTIVLSRENQAAVRIPEFPAYFQAV